MNNSNQPEHSGARQLPAWAIFAFGFLIALQIVNLVLFFWGYHFLYNYINNVDHRLNESMEKSRTEIIQLFKRG